MREVSKRRLYHWDHVLSYLHSHFIHLLTYIPFRSFSIPPPFLLDHVVLPEAEWVGGIIDSIIESMPPRVLASLSIQTATGMAVDLETMRLSFRFRSYQASHARSWANDIILVTHNIADSFPSKLA